MDPDERDPHDKRMPQASNRTTQDLHLVQALTETRRLATRHRDEPAWREVDELVAELLAAVGASARGDPIDAARAGMDRIDRTAIHASGPTADQVTAALTALAERPHDDRQLQLAERSLKDLRRTLR